MVSIGISVSVGTNAVTRVPKGTTVTIRASCTWESEYPRRLWIAIDQDPNGNVTDPAWVRELYDTDRPAGGALLEGQIAVNLVGTWGFKAYFKWMDEEGGYHTLGPAGWALEVYEPPPPPPPPPEPQPPPPEPGLKITVEVFDASKWTDGPVPIAGATVKVCSDDFNYKWKGQTNSKGICVTPDLAPGDYMIIVGKKGYNGQHGYMDAGRTIDFYLNPGTYPSLDFGINPQPAKPGQYVSFFGWAYGIAEGATVTFEIFGTDSLWHSVASTTMGFDVGYGTDWLVPSECYGRKPGEDWRFRAKSGATVSGEVTLTVQEAAPLASIEDVEAPSIAGSGESIQVKVKLKNTGIGTGKLVASIIDRDNGQVVGAQTETPSLSPGQSASLVWDLTMPAKVWKLRAEAGH
jgi:hypothetical protein